MAELTPDSEWQNKLYQNGMIADANTLNTPHIALRNDMEEIWRFTLTNETGFADNDTLLRDDLKNDPGNTLAPKRVVSIKGLHETTLNGGTWT